jgi:hypothetical protein
VMRHLPLRLPTFMSEEHSSTGAYDPCSLCQVKYVPSPPPEEAVVVEYGTPCTLLEDSPEQTVEVFFEKEIPSPSNGCETTTTPRGHVTVTQVSLRQICGYSTNNVDQKALGSGSDL